MGRVTDLMDFNYQNQVSNEKVQSMLAQITLGISKASINNGSFLSMVPIFKRELPPVDEQRYPGLSNLHTFLEAMSRVMQETAGLAMPDQSYQNNSNELIGDSEPIDISDFNRTR